MSRVQGKVSKAVPKRKTVRGLSEKEREVLKGKMKWHRGLRMWVGYLTAWEVMHVGDLGMVELGKEDIERAVGEVTVGRMTPRWYGFRDAQAR